MSYYDIRTMTGKEVLIGLLKANDYPLTLTPQEVTFSNVTAVPTEERPGKTSFTMAVEGYRGTASATYGRVLLSSVLTDLEPIELLKTDTQAELIDKLNTDFQLNLGLDDYVITEGPLSTGGTELQYTLKAASGSLVWFGEVVINIIFNTPRELEDGTIRLNEDGTIRMLED